MAFNVTKRLQDGWELVVLEDDRSGSYIEIIPEAGAIINAFKIVTGNGNPLNIIDGYKDRSDFIENVHRGFKSAKLSPFVCRLKNGAYKWEGKNYRIDKFMLNTDALHGILYDAKFEVIDIKAGEHECHAEMSYDYGGEIPGYPFPYTCKVRYSFSENNTLGISTTIINLDPASSIPMGDGWHPYFRLGGKVDGWWLKVASDQMLEYDEGLIPTGKLVSNADFLEGRKIGAIKLDNGFLLKENVSPICVLKNPENNVVVEFISAENYPYLQLYIPDHRETIAIENLGTAPDSFNNGMGLYNIKPGEEISFNVCIRTLES
jgi:aldose 1-epimerase